MAAGQHSRRDGGVPAAGRETARHASLEVTRRALLGAVCAAPVLSRHPGLGSHQSTTLMGSLDPGSTFSPSAPEGRWIPDQVRDDDGQVRQSETSAVPIWDRALARFHKAQAALDAAAHEPDQDSYDDLPDAHTDALCALLALPASDLAAVAAKLDLIVAHLAWELTGGEDCLEVLRGDAHRLAAAGAEVQLAARLRVSA
jgi:hypothetical protein